MDVKYENFKSTFTAFVEANFKDLNAFWRVQTREAFMRFSLTPEQINFLLTPDFTTSQFRAEFEQSIKNKGLPTHICFAASGTEPINKIATYLSSAKDDEAAQIEVIRKAANVLPAISWNMRGVLKNGPYPESFETYEKVSTFADAAMGILTTAGIPEITDIRDLDGMHHVSAMPENIL